MSRELDQRAAICARTADYRKGIRNATVTDIRTAAPQLKESEAEALLAKFETGVHTVNFAGPPVLVHGAVRIYQLCRGPSLVSPLLTITQIQRDNLATYLTQPCPVPESRAQPRALPAAETWRAIDYATASWLRCLRWDDWRDVIIGFILQPGTKPERWYGTTQINMLQFETAETATPLLNPVPVEIDLALQDYTFDESMGGELAGDRLPFVVFNCGCCGGGVFNYRCVFCEQGYGADDSHGFRQTKWPWPLPTKVAQAIKNDFSIDPVEARKACYARWARTNFRPPAGPETYKESRSVQLD